MNAAIPRDMHEDVAQRDLGAVLKSARTDAGLTVADVSQQLHLADTVITALEANEHGDLPAAFVRGYVRAYGKLLDLDGERLVELYNRSGIVDPDIAPVTALASQHARGDPLMRWMTAVVIAVLAVMVVVYWQTEDSVPPPLVQTDPVPSPAPAAPSGPAVAPYPVTDARATSARDEPAGETAPAAAMPSAPPPVAAAEARSSVASAAGPAESETPAAEPSADEPPAAAGAETPASATGYETVAGTAATGEADPAPANGQPLATVPAASVAVATPAADAAAAAPGGEATAAAAETASVGEGPEPAESRNDEPAPPPAPLAGDDELLLTVRGESWVEVTDPGGARLFYGLYRAGDELRITGQAPFTVFLGNSPDVEVQLNGELHDQSAFNRRNNTARFKLDADGPRRN